MGLQGLCRVLIVDDETLIRQGIKHYLNWEQEGFTIVGEAANGKEALTLIKEQSPHIVITDIVMPHMNGEELTKNIKEHFPNIKVIILSSFADFDYVKSALQSGAVDYILKPKLNAEELLQVLHKTKMSITSFVGDSKDSTKDKLFKNTLEKILSGYAVSVDQTYIESSLPHMNLCLISQSFHHDHSPLSIEQDRDISLTKVIVHKLEWKQNEILYILNGSEEEIEALLSILQDKESTTKTTYYISQYFTDILQLRNMYVQLNPLKNFTFYQNQVTYLRKIQYPTLHTKDMLPFNLETFTEELKRKRFSEAFQQLIQYSETLSTCYGLEIYEYKSFFENIIFTVTVLLNNMGYDVKELEEERFVYFNHIQEATDATSPIMVLKTFLKKVEQIVTSNQTTNNHMMQMITHYIQENFSKPLTLSSVAQEFHFNASYLSNYFSTHNHESFVEFLNKVRVEESMILLTKNEYSISEISSRVGFSDHSYYCKVFKKVTGMSPSEYKRRYKKQ